MSGYAFAIGTCFACGTAIVFNPVKVPSLRPSVSGEKYPLCRACANRWNQIHRIDKGLPPVEIAPDAYEPCSENELWATMLPAPSAGEK
jgi:hypothetical protein